MTRAAQDPLGGQSARPPKPAARVPWAYFLVFVAGTALVLTAIWYHIESERQSIMDHWKARIGSIADDRARLIENWLAHRRADAEVLAAFPAVKTLLASQNRRDEALVQHLNRVAAAYGYAGIAIFDTEGRVVARSSGDAGLGSENIEAAAAVARSRKFSIDLREELPQRRLLTFSVPVLSDGGPARAQSDALGVVTLRMKPETGLYPLLTDESASSRTGETLLFRLGPGEPAYLSPLRHTPAGWAAMSRSLNDLRDLAGATSGGQRGFGELTDYRAVTVLAATRWIAPTGWGLILKVDRDEALAEFYRTGQLAGASAAFLLLALAGFLISLWRKQQGAQLLRAQVEQERAISNLKGYAETIVASVPSGLLLLSADLRVLSANRSFLDSFHAREEEILSQELQNVISADALIRRAREVLQTGVAQRDVLFDLRLTPRQETRPALVTLTGIRMADGAAARLLLIIQDLTEEQRLQAARQTSEQRFRDLVQSLDAIVWEADAATLQFSFVSQRAESILGYPVARWLSERDFFRTRIHPDDRERAMEIGREAIAGCADHEFEYRAVAADGREVWLRDIVHVVRGAAGRAVQLRGLTVDLTELKRSEEALRQAEDQLRHAQKMDAVGKLAGGIAHDFNNLLMVIRGDSDLLLRRLPQEHALRAHAEGIREAADQASTLTRQLLAFSRKQVLAPMVLDINTVVAGTHKMLQRLLGETINLVTVTAPDLGRVTADPGQIEQLILNLAVNARDAMPDGGLLSIRTANVEVDETAARRQGSVKPGSYVMLEVSDTGTGMDAETRAHLFEPFFTTKDESKGTGLGLSTVYGIVNQSGGHVWVESEPGQGTTFRIYLPRVEEAVPPQVASEGAAPAHPEERAPAGQLDATQGGAPQEELGAPSRGETVLLVEDAHRVRAVVREILEMNGYVVLEARHGAEALTISSEYRGPIHLMVTDVVMPEMSGRELAQQLAPLRPEMKVLYMSGYTDDAIVRHGVLGAGMAFLSKPFTPDALAAKAREVLDAPRKKASEPARPPGRNAAGDGASRPERAPRPAASSTEGPEGLGHKRSRG